MQCTFTCCCCCTVNPASQAINECTRPLPYDVQCGVLGDDDVYGWMDGQDKVIVGATRGVYMLDWHLHWAVIFMQALFWDGIDFGGKRGGGMAWHAMAWECSCALSFYPHHLLHHHHPTAMSN